MEAKEKPRVRQTQTPEQRRQRAQLLEALTYEMWDGKPVYYAGYRDVVSGDKTIDQVISSSILQSRIVTRLCAYLLGRLDLTVYDVLGSELGVQFKKSDWRACDIAVFELAVLANEDLEKYAWVSPKIVIEVDTKADMARFGSDVTYYHKKTQQLLDFGAERVIWIFTKSRKIWVCEPGKNWITTDWNPSIEVMPGCSFVLDQLV